MHDNAAARCCALTIIIFLALQGFVGPVSVCHAAVSNLNTQALAEDSFLSRVLYSVPKRLASNIGEDGAIGSNREWEKGGGEKFFIEEQRHGGDLVQCGIAMNDPASINLGLKVIEWGFNHQAADGSFPGTGDAFHSVSMFVEGSARALLSLREANLRQYAGMINKLAPKLAASGHWLEQPEIERVGKNHDAPYTHRRWILAAALAETAELIGDRSMANKATAYADEGLSLQLASGINPEKGGYDVSYQAVGILEGARYFVACHDPHEQREVKAMIERACDWEMSMIGDDGQIKIGDSTRIEHEKARSGKIKHVNIKEVLQALSYATAITGNDRYRAKADAVARAQGWL